jgi:O-antigen/teichoic acid export membrane protein
MVYLYIDRLAINALMSIGDVGLFGVGYRVASIITLLMAGFQGALLPLVYHRYQDASTPAELARIFRYFTAAALLLTAGLSMFAREALAVLSTPDYYAAWAVIPLLVPAAILSNMVIFAPGLGIAKKTGLIAAINIAGATINTLLNLALIPLLGIQGAALATFISAAIIFIVYLRYSQRLYPVPHRWPQLGLAALLTIAAVFVGVQFDYSSWGNIAVKLLLGVALAASFLWLGLARLKDLRAALGILTRTLARRVTALRSGKSAVS